MLTSRYYESEHDLRQMQDLLMAARAATDDWRYPHIGVATFRFFMVACHLNPYEYVRLWHDRRGHGGRLCAARRGISCLRLRGGGG